MATPPEVRVSDELARVGPRQTFENLTAENDALILEPQLANARQTVTARSAIYTGLVLHWAREQHQAFGYAKPFAVVALGGTGRAEMVPSSDSDFAFLFDDSLEGNQFLKELQHQVLHSDKFEERCGFSFNPLPFTLDDAGSLSGKQLNSFLDMRPVYDPDGLADRFRERIRATFDPFEHFLHVRRFWKEQWEKAAGESERVDRFDIKNEGLRIFLAGIWTLAGNGFLHSAEVYQTLEDKRDLESYEFLLRVRAFVHLLRRRSRQTQPNRKWTTDVLDFEDFSSFSELLGSAASEKQRLEFAEDVRARLLSSRRRVAQFAKGIIGHALHEGREIRPGNPIVFGFGGLHYRGFDPGQKSKEKSRAALSLLVASQKYGVPVDPDEIQGTFRSIGDWLVRVPELSALFYEPQGSLADSFEFLSQFDGAEERLFPGHAKFEASLDRRVMLERAHLRSALQRRKMRQLEQWLREGQEQLATAVSAASVIDITRGLSVAVEAALLSPDHRAGVKLALKSKRLPLSPEDIRLREDITRPLVDKFTTGFSNIPLQDYFRPFVDECDFSVETVRTAEFLIANRRAFKEWAQTPINDARQVEEFARTCRDEQLLRALFVFTYADHSEWESDREEPARWFHTRELYRKTMMFFRPGADPTLSLQTAGFSPEQLAILKDFGADFFAGVYRQYANRFGEHLVRLCEEHGAVGAKAGMVREGTSTIIGVAAKDYRGLAASLTGALWHHNIQASMAHLFTASNHGLVLDFFHVAPGGKLVGAEVLRSIEAAVRHRLYIGEQDESHLPTISGQASLLEWRPGQYCLRFETAQATPGLLYALAYRVFRYLGGSIFGLSCQPAGGGAYVTVYHSLPPDLSLPRAQELVAQRF